MMGSHAGASPTHLLLRARAIVLGCLFLAVPFIACRADDAPLSLYGGAAKLMSPDDTSIRMDTETVVIALSGRLYTVDAEFQFYNAGPSTTVAVGFPSVADRSYPEDGEPLVNFETWVDGRKLPVELLPSARRSWVARGGKPQEETHWLVKEVSFPAGAMTRVRVRYDAAYREGEAQYLFGTGGAWRGNIGKAMFLVKPAPSLAFPGFKFTGIGKTAPRAFRAADSAWAVLLSDFKPEEGASIFLNRIQSVWETAGLETCALDYGNEYFCSDLGPGDVESGGWKYSTQPVPRDALASLSSEGLRLFRNAFFAVHGRAFEDPGLAAEFSKKAWYKPRAGFRMPDLSAVEKRNVRAISEREKELAAAFGDPGRSARLLAGYADLRTLRDAGRSVEVAAEAGRRESPDVAALKGLLDAGADPDSRGEGGRTALMAAAWARNAAAVKLLLERGAEVGARDPRGRTALTWAIQGLPKPARQDSEEGRARVLAIVRLLLGKGAGARGPGDSGFPALNEAANAGDPELVELLLTRADLTADGGPALAAAVRGGRQDVVDLLLRKGAGGDAQVKASGASLMNAAAWSGDVEMLRYFLDRGAPLEGRPGSDPPLVLASQRHQPEAVGFLLDRGANIDSRGVGGETGLMRAAGACHEDVAKLLLARGARTDLADAEGKTAADHAVCGTVSAMIKAARLGPSRP